MRSPLSKCGVLLTSLCTASALAASALAAEVPPPSTLTVEKLDAYCDEIRSSAAGETSVGARNQVIQQKLGELISARAKEYQGYEITVTSKTKNASLGTKLNFSTEKKHVSFTIAPPPDIPGLEIADFPSKPSIKKTRGNDKRIEGRSAKKTSADQVTFRFTLVEPNAAEKNIHVEYNGWVKYRYTADGAMAAATKDLASVKTFAEELKSTAIPVSPTTPEAEVPVLPTKADVPPPAGDKDVPAASKSDTEKGPFSWNEAVSFFLSILSGLIVVMLPKIWRKLRRKYRSKSSSRGAQDNLRTLGDITRRIPPLPTGSAQEKTKKKDKKSFADLMRGLFRWRISAGNE